MVRLQDRSLGSLVDIERGMISREVYTSEDIYRQELEQIFMRAWLFVGHESMVPNPGDFAASRMGAEEVLLVRDRKGTIHVFLNTCRHRGMKVCRYDSGNALVFTCPFHAWTYDTSGKLVGVGHAKEAYGPDFDKGEEVFMPIMRWRIPTNWKFPAFSFAGDSSHAAMTHLSVNAAAIGPQGAREGGGRGLLQAPFPRTHHEMVSEEYGHGGHMTIYQQPGVPPYRDTWDRVPGADDYFREARDRKAEKYD